MSAGPTATATATAAASDDFPPHTARIVVAVVWALSTIPAVLAVLAMTTFWAITTNGGPRSCAVISRMAAWGALLVAATVVCPLTAVLIWFVPDPPSAAFLCAALLPVFVWGGLLCVPGMVWIGVSECVVRLEKKRRRNEGGGKDAGLAAVDADLLQVVP
ncbi:hypothetical protein HK405_002787 [Cladochytrium tenue]|nr:hypothetical protein HK405_002787 [Cladochytrium tenue]